MQHPITNQTQQKHYQQNNPTLADNNGASDKANSQASKSTQKTQPWCKRAGNIRICLACGQESRSNPNGCSCVEHQKAFKQKKAYQRSYFQKHKKRLLRQNSDYRRKHPEAREWNRKYGKAWYLRNRKRKQAKARLWERKHAAYRRDYLRDKAREWHRKNPDRSRANSKRYYQNNKARKNGRRNELLKEARRNHPGERFLQYFRSRLSTFIRRGGTKRFSITRDVLTYTADELRQHMEKQFTGNMCWANYATVWEIDHIKECVHFDLTDVEQACACFALSNLRPLEIKQNRGRSTFRKSRLKPLPQSP